MEIYDVVRRNVRRTQSKNVIFDTCKEERRRDVSSVLDEKDSVSLRVQLEDGVVTWEMTGLRTVNNRITNDSARIKVSWQDENGDSCLCTPSFFLGEMTFPVPQRASKSYFAFRNKAVPFPNHISSYLSSLTNASREKEWPDFEEDLNFWIGLRMKAGLRYAGSLFPLFPDDAPPDLRQQWSDWYQRVQSRPGFVDYLKFKSEAQEELKWLGLNMT
jgi:hypothetical protein